MRLIVILMLALAAPLAHAGAREQLDAFGAGMTGMSADFEQRVHAPDGELLESSSGTLKLRAPRQFRWEVVQPFPQVIVADGTHVWIHDPDLEQVTVRIQSHEEQGSPLSVLVDPSELERQFEVSGHRADGLDWLGLTPRKPVRKRPPGLRRQWPGGDGNERRPGPAHRGAFQRLAAQSGLRGRHLRLHPAAGHRGGGRDGAGRRSDAAGGLRFGASAGLRAGKLRR